MVDAFVLGYDRGDWYVRGPKRVDDVFLVVVHCLCRDQRVELVLVG